MKSPVIYSLLCSSLVLAGCNKKSGAPAAGGMPPSQVVMIPAQSQAVTETLSLVGSLAANEWIEIKTEIDGAVADIRFQEGQLVEKGDLLINLDASKLEAMAAEAEANFKLSQSNFDRAKELSQKAIVAQQELDQASSSFASSQAGLDLKKRQLKDARIVAPFRGVMGTRLVSPGQVISKNTTITYLVDLDPVKVEINVPERFLSQLKNGQTVAVHVAAFPGRTFQGEVFFIAPQLDPATRTLLIKARVANQKLELKPGMLATLDLSLETRANAVVIPEAALSQVMDNNRAMVYVVGSDGTVGLRPVQLGVRQGGTVEILQGLEAGQQVIVEGSQKVFPGAKVKAAPAESSEPYLKLFGPKKS